MSRPINTPRALSARNLVRSTAFLTVLFGAVAHAASSHQHEAHVHGQGELNVAIDANDLQVELIVPAVDVVGFEHAPRTAKQRQAVASAVERFASSKNWLRLLPEGSCEIEEVSINLLGEQRLHEDDHGDSAQHAKETHKHEADKHGHGHEADKDGHGHEAKHESDAHKHEGHADESEHAELHLEYRFHCSQAQPPVELELHLANVGLDVDELKVTILSANAQTVRRIGAAKTVLSLR